VLVEGVVIVGSILLAFALDAWWDNQSRVAELREQAQVVAGEMAAAREALQSAHNAHELNGDFAAHLTDVLRSVPEGAEVVVSDTLVGPLLPQTTADVNTGSVEAFIAAGGLELVEGAEIRTALLGWSTRIEDLQDDEVHHRDFAAADLNRYLRANYAIANAERWGVSWLRARFGVEPPVDPGVLGTVRLQHERQLLNLLAARESGERGLRRGLVEMMEDAETIRAALEEMR